MECWPWSRGHDSALSPTPVLDLLRELSVSPGETEIGSMIRMRKRRSQLGQTPTPHLPGQRRWCLLSYPTLPAKPPAAVMTSQRGSHGAIPLTIPNTR